MTTTIKGISSMATRLLLNDLAEAYQRSAGATVDIEAVGGVDAAKRVQAGEPFDVVFLSADAIDKLIASGQVLPGSRVAAHLRANSRPREPWQRSKCSPKADNSIGEEHCHLATF